MTARVVLTTAPGSLDGLEATLADVDVRIVRHPLLTFAPPASWTALDAALAASWDAIVLTSPRAADVLAARAPHLAPHRNVWAAGDASAAPLRARGWTVHAADGGTATQSAATSLALAMLAAGVRGRVLHVAGDPHRTELAERLRDGGCTVEAAIAYRSVPASDVELSAVLLRAHVLVVGSPLLVRALAAQGDDALGPAWVALGATTAETIRAAGLPLAAVADDPSAPGVALAIRRALHLTSLD